MMYPGEQHARRALDEIRRLVDQVTRLALQDRWETNPGDFGRDNWLAIASRNGQRHIKYLRNLGKDWLSAQSPDVQVEVDEAEAMFGRLKAIAIIEGARHLPSDLPPDPFGNGPLG